MPALDINTDASVVFAAKLERMGKSVLNVVVRRTLNSSALDVKRETMPAQSDIAFIKRKPTFFPATSSVDLAKGLNINDMQATVGFVAPAGIKESGHATKDLEDQEHGGAIDKRAFIATDKGRTGRGNVKDSLTMNKIKQYIRDAKNEDGKNDGENFIRAAVKEGVGGFVIGTGKNSRGNRALLKIIAIHRLKTGEGSRRGKYLEEGKTFSGNMVVKTQEVYSVKGKRKAHVKATHFMKIATDETVKKMPRIFADYCETAINKMK